MEADIKLVKELRQMSGVGIGECKKALAEAENDIDKAFDILKNYGATVANKKASRTANEGKTSIYLAENRVLILELNSETDFVARNEGFIELVDKIGKAGIENNVSNLEELKKAKTDSGAAVEDVLNDAIGKIKENMILKRCAVLRFDPSREIVGSYVHMNGKTSAVVILDTEGDKSDDSVQLARDLAVNTVASMGAAYISREDIPVEILEKAKENMLNQDVFQNKPDKVKEMILKNKIDEFAKESSLVEQSFVKDPDITVAELINRVSKKIGKKIVFKSFVKYVLGE